MDKGKVISGIAQMLGLVALGVCIVVAVSKYRSFDRTVDVKGLCEKEIPADRVIWPIMYKVVANDIQTIYDQIDSNKSVIINFLQSGGIDSVDITVSVPNLSDKLAEEYGNNDRAYRFIATNVITVCTNKVDKVLELMSRQSELLKSGVLIGAKSWENQVEFKYEGLNSIKPQMIEEATQNARKTAKKFAKDSGSKLGKIKTANQGVFTIDARDSNTPHIKKVRVVTSVTYYLKD